jgi:hypothetical protein
MENTHQPLLRGGVGRWKVSVGRTGIVFTRLPDPGCTECGGKGGWFEERPEWPSLGPEPMECPCSSYWRRISWTSPLHTLRRLCRKQRFTEPPF